MLTNAPHRLSPAQPGNGIQRIRQMLGSVRENCYAWIFRRYARRNSVAFRQSLDAAGFQVARNDDYYSPLPSVAHLKANEARWNRPSSLRGIEYDLASMKQALVELLAGYLDEFLTYPPYAQIQKMGFGQGYTAVDALTLYMMIRHLKPRRYIEVGSGVSTYYCSLAAQRNESEGHPLQITCIEPYPFEKLATIPGIRLLAQKVEDVEISLFQELQENDVLFIDSSHILRVDGDVPFLYLEVLPGIHPGVVTHIHDIPYPFNSPYPPKRWIFQEGWPMFWNEPMVLQAFLAFNKNFKICLSTPLIRYFDEPFLQQTIPIYESVAQNPNTFSSIWLRRIS
jgi:hypothetical protein